jgi:hypothetical protein
MSKYIQLLRISVPVHIPITLFLLLCTRHIHNFHSCYAWTTNNNNIRAQQKAPSSSSTSFFRKSYYLHSNLNHKSWNRKGWYVDGHVFTLNQYDDGQQQQQQQQQPEGDEDGKKDEKHNSKEYKPATFSKSFLAHMEQVKGGYSNSNNSNNEEGVDCTGEPSMDPSRMVQDDGLDSEYLNDFS